jgi:hypothetical protein
MIIMEAVSQCRLAQATSTLESRVCDIGNSFLEANLRECSVAHSIHLCYCYLFTFGWTAPPPICSGTKAQVTDLEATLEAKETELAQVAELCKTRTRQVLCVWVVGWVEGWVSVYLSCDSLESIIAR